jgi:hypothetical protein
MAEKGLFLFLLPCEMNFLKNIAIRMGKEKKEPNRNDKEASLQEKYYIP